MKKNSFYPLSRKQFIEKGLSGLVALGLAPVAIKGSRKKPEATPRLRTLGRTGFKVGGVGLGASRTMEPMVVKTALDAGVNFIDTGRAYYDGQNEEMIGKVIKGMRDKVIIQSKKRLSLGRRKIEQLPAGAVKMMIDDFEKGLNESLSALQTDYVDIFLIHGASTPDVIKHEAVQDFFTNAKTSGKIRACGFSCHNNQAEMIRIVHEEKFYDSIMITFNHKGSYVHSNTGRFKEWDQVALKQELIKAHENNIGIVAMKTCSAGPYAFENEEPSMKSALKWILGHDYIHTMAVAMRSLEEVEEDVQVL